MDHLWRYEFENCFLGPSYHGTWLVKGESKQWTLCLFDPGPRLMFSSVMLHNYSLETFQVARVGNFASLATCGLGVEFERVQVWPETTMLWKYCTAVMMICYNTALTDTQGSRQWNYCRNAVTYICTTGLLSVELTRPGPDLTFVVGHNDGSPFCGPFVILGPCFEPDHHLWPFSVLHCLQFGF